MYWSMVPLNLGMDELVTINELVDIVGRNAAKSIKGFTTSLEFRACMVATATILVCVKY